MRSDGEQKGRQIHDGANHSWQHEYRQANQHQAARKIAKSNQPTAEMKVNPLPAAAVTQYQTHQIMIAPRQKILIKQRHQYKASTNLVAALLWPLVICSLLQLSANLLYIINEASQASALNYPSHLPPSSSLLGVEDGRDNFGCIPHHGALSPGPAHQQKLSSSSTSKISSSTTTLLYSEDVTQGQKSSPPPAAIPAWKSAYLSLSKFFDTLTTIHRRSHGRSIWGGKVLLAQAVSLYQANQDKAIIILNSSNLYPELLQNRHPFRHIKLIEYYVSYCGVCARFKTTYTKLAKAIYPWRNVMRPSAIDLGVSNNSPVALAWTIRVIPALTINPPPDMGLAQKLDKQFSNWSTTLQPIELHRSMFAQYNSSHLFVQTLDVSRYMDKTDLLKADLLVHIENYVRNNSANLPATWPNLRPVTETTLASLLRDHPRQELFLLIEGNSVTEDQSTRPNLGLNIILELSTSAPWKSIRYMRANENKALLEDVIMEQKRVCDSSAATSSSCTEQVELLNNLLSNKPIGANDMLLIHIDGSHGPPRRAGGLGSPGFPLIKIITRGELSNMEQSGLLGQKQQENLNTDRAKRAINHLTRKTRSLFDSGNPSTGSDKMSSERTVELLVQYINLTYVETIEDRNFLNAINNNLINDNVRATPEDTIDSGNLSGPISSGQVGEELTSTASSLMTHIYDMLSIRDKKQQPTHQQTTTNTNYSFPDDYEDKLKAIRYMLFSEVPRSSLHADKNSQDQQDRLNILINLVSVIKSYFPLPDASSIQFIAGVHAYLIKQARLTSISNQGRMNGGSFDVSAYKQELKRLEWENKRLPEVKEYKLCVNSGYPCALWRLFHTLAAFEYKKLSEIRRQAVAPSSSHLHSPSGQLQHPHPDTSFPPSGSSFSSGSEVITTMKSPPTGSSHDGGLQSPVEHLVSPPSTTTSLSLTIATPTSLSSQQQQQQASETSGNNRLLNEADLPTPVVLVMRDYITTFFSCEECRRNFRSEASELSLERIRQQEPAEYSVLWLWEVHNRVSKRLSMEPVNTTSTTTTESSPKVWFPTYEQCVSCYRKAPSFQQMLPAVDQVTMFQESIDWNKREVLSFLTHEYLRNPLEKSSCSLFENHLLYIGLLAAISCSCLLFMLVHRCTSMYLERQRRHKANILNGNAAHTYSLALNE